MLETSCNTENYKQPRMSDIRNEELTHISESGPPDAWESEGLEGKIPNRQRQGCPALGNFVLFE